MHSLTSDREPRPTNHCSRCGRFVGEVRAVLGYSVTGGYPYFDKAVADCKTHGEVSVIRTFDGEEWPYGWDDWEWESKRGETI